jgi:hypothetical protein
MQRMPIAGTAMIALGFFFVFLGIGSLVLGESLQPGPVHLGGPSQAYWGRSPGAIFIALGLSAGWVGWCFLYPEGRGKRKHHEKSRRNS